MIKDFVKCGIGVDVSVVCMSLIDDLLVKLVRMLSGWSLGRYGTLRMAVVRENSCGYKE